MNAAAERVRAESERFQAALPELLKTLSGRWVVFKDGAVQSDHATEAEAYRASIDRFGIGGGQVVAPVVELHPTLLTAALAFGVL